mmetsp:Transcript_21912/g.36214  ORF Transcript_21912/g.36214 Transcript_21912/m.36214 type:complete len:140 (+) Transcript_21912:119-538(+)
MASNITFMGLVLLSNSLFLSNYLFVRSARLTTDFFTKVRRLKSQQTPEDTAEESPAANGNALVLSGAAMAFCFGIQKKEVHGLHRFIDWEPIRYHAGLISTSVLIILFAVLFSDPVLNGALGIDASGSNSTSQGRIVLC